MKVKELIETLQKFNPEAEVMRESIYWDEDYQVTNVTIYNNDIAHVFLEFDEER